MTRKTRSLKWTALAIAMAFIVAPAANSGGKLPNVSTSKVSTLSKQAAKTAKQQPAQHDRFIVTYKAGAKKLSAAAEPARNWRPQPRHWAWASHRCARWPPAVR